MGEDLRSKITDLEREVSGLLIELEKIDGEARRLAEEKRALINKVRELRAKALEYKSIRDSLNEEVKSFKATLAGLKQEYIEKLDSLKRLKRSIKEYLRLKPAKSEEILAKEIANLDWKIQTIPMTISEEQKIIEQIKTLERQMEFYRKLRSMEDEIGRLEGILNEIRDKATFYRNKIAEKVSESRIFHDKMIKIFNEISELKNKLSEISNKYLENRNEAAKLRLKHRELLNKIHTMKSIIREEEERRKREAISALKERVKKETLEKIKRGEKVSFEEFKILVEDEETI